MTVQFPPKVAADNQQIRAPDANSGADVQNRDPEDSVERVAVARRSGGPVGPAPSAQASGRVPRQLLVDLGFLVPEGHGRTVGELSDDAVTTAVRALQKTLSVPASGQFDAATQQAVKTYVTAVQESLTRLDLYDDAANGFYREAMRESVREFQRNAGLEVTGRLTPETYVKIEEQLQAKYGG